MINRILIRIKVIQILYSFLLVEKQFVLEPQPSSPTKEKRFAYSLYQDLLVLFVKLSEAVAGPSGRKPLLRTQLVTRLLLDESLKALIRKYQEQAFPLAGAVDGLIEKIQDSGIYKNYLKDLSSGTGEENLWQNIFNLIIAPDPRLNELIAGRDNFTLKAWERTKDMINRTFVNFLASHENISEVEKALAGSLDKARELYLRLLWLPVELTEMEDRLIDDNRHKFLKTQEDINPNMRFVDNRIVARLRDNRQLSDWVEKNKISWLSEDPLMMRKLLQVIKSSDIYATYMSSPLSGVQEDSDLWRMIFKNIILENPDFLETLEEKSVFWNDDLEIMTTFILKTLKRLEDENAENVILDQYKDEEDARFGSELLRLVYRDKENLRLYINDALEGGNWDKERLAFMDIVILLTALAEILNFPKIPLQVSINEYIELAKSYSTPKSGIFVNGILGAVVRRLQKDGLLLKK